MWSKLAISIQSGNIYIGIIIFLAFCGCVIIFERFTMLNFVYNINFSKFISDLKKAVRAEDLDRAAYLCKNSSHTSLPKIGRKALESAERDPTSVRGTIEEETIEFLPNLETRLRVLPTLSTLILLTGILATIDGIWNVFISIEVLDTIEKQTTLSSSIAGTLYPTVLGLIVSMVFLATHQILQGMALKLTEKIHLGSTVLINLLVPQDVAYVSPLPIGMTSQVQETKHDTQQFVHESTKEEDISVSTVVKSEEDEFDDSAVKDIKDEEEII